MKIGEKIIRILCYGDSNTFGQHSFVYERYNPIQRWTGIIQSMLDTQMPKIKGEFEIIEEGLCARTAGNLEIKEKEYRNGLNTFKASVLSHHPLNIVIISLGTNDLKTRLNRTVHDIINDLLSYDDILVDTFTDTPDLIYITPPIITNDLNLFMDCEKKSQEIALSLIKMSVNRKFSVVDLSDIRVSGDDGIHFSAQDHITVANRVLLSLSNNTHNSYSQHRNV
jgi:lysophospholipase L1-like esterase